MIEFIPRFSNNAYEQRASVWSAQLAETTNIQLGNTAQNVAGYSTNLLSGATGIPQVAQVGNSLLGSSTNYSPLRQFQVSQLNSYRDIPGIAYPDFRARKPGFSRRLDGTSAATRGSVFAGVYAAASISTGPYAVFNLDGVGKTGFGFGDHDNPYALRNDFTATSHIGTQWREGKWKPTRNPLALATPFRGDKVNVIDFGKRTKSDIYKWKRRELGATLGISLLDKLNVTQDLIKFFFTGPKLQNGVAESETDDVIVFRAIIGSLSDTFSPNWTPITMIGRADPNYHYTGVTRDISLDFTVYAADRDEMKFIYRKLNALAGYTAPEYDKTSIAMRAPWMRMTIGDLFHQQAVIITSLSYTFQDADTMWEINIEKDPEMMQVPHKVSVSMGLTPIMDFLPQKGGQFYSLNNSEYDKFGQPSRGNQNWLSDAVPTDPAPLTAEQLASIAEAEVDLLLLNQQQELASATAADADAFLNSLPT
jgi:hypothetical protein